MRKISLLLTVATVLNLITLKTAEAALLVAGRGSKSVLSYDEQTGEFNGSFIPPGSGGLSSPSSLAFGSDGRLYVSDYNSSSVLRYDSLTGNFIDTFIPSGSGGLKSPESIAFGSDGNLYIGGLDGNGIKRYNGKTGEFIDDVISSDPATKNQLNTASFAFGSNNELFAGSVFPTGGIIRHDTLAGNASTFIPSSDSPVIPGGLAIGPDGNLYAGDFSPDATSIRRYNIDTGKFIDTFVAPGSGGLKQSSRLLFQPEGDKLYLYITSFGNNSVLRYDGRTGQFIDTFVSSGSGGLKDPIGLAFTPRSSTVSVPEPTSYLSILGVGVYLSANLIRLQQKKTVIKIGTKADL